MLPISVFFLSPNQKGPSIMSFTTIVIATLVFCGILSLIPGMVRIAQLVPQRKSVHTYEPQNGTIIVDSTIVDANSGGNYGR